MKSLKLFCEGLSDDIYKRLPPSEAQRGEQLGYIDNFRTMDGVIENVPVNKLNPKHLQVFKDNGLIEFDEEGEIYFTQYGINWLDHTAKESYLKHSQINPRLQKFQPTVRDTSNDVQNMAKAFERLSKIELPDPGSIKDLAKEFDVSNFDLYNEALNRYWRYYHHKHRGSDWRDIIGDQYDSKFGIEDV
jgi:hypothetical protein